MKHALVPLSALDASVQLQLFLLLLGPALVALFLSLTVSSVHLLVHAPNVIKLTFSKYHWVNVSHALQRCSAVFLVSIVIHVPAVVQDK